MIKRNSRRVNESRNSFGSRKPATKTAGVSINEGKVVTINGTKYQYVPESAQEQEVSASIESMLEDIYSQLADTKVSTDMSFQAKIRTNVDASIFDAAYDLDILDQEIETGEEQDSVAVTISSDDKIHIVDDNFGVHFATAAGINDIDATAIIDIQKNGRVLVQGHVNANITLTLAKIADMQA